MLKNKHKTDDNFEILLHATYKNTEYVSKNITPYGCICLSKPIITIHIKRLNGYLGVDL